MGGYGSSRWGWHSAKSVAEDCRQLDINRFNRKGMLNGFGHFSWSWYRNDKRVADIRIHVQKDLIVLSYKFRISGSEWQDVEYTVTITYTNCNYGGRRPWFICPNCNKRVAKLYSDGPRFLCRHCYRLAYTSQKERAEFRLLHKVQDIRTRLGGSAATMDPFPDRPKGMHRRTYNRLQCEALLYESRMWAAMAEHHGIKY